MNQHNAPKFVFNEQALGVSGEQDGQTLQLNCPICHESFAPDGSEDFCSVQCSSCGSSFGMLGQARNQSALKPGSNVGRFELQEFLGRGGFGTVWKAFDPQLDRCVALKIPKWLDPTVADGEAFLREARSAAQVRHRHVVAVHEVGTDGERLYLVSDLIIGQSLSERLSQGRIPIRKTVEWCEKLAHALQAVHDAGITHRDLKPGNILIDEEGEPYLTDFGLARRMDGELTLTTEGQVVGTCAYLSPELALGMSHSADGRCDIFSFGTILYQLLTGELPFRGSHHATVNAIIEDDPAPPRSLDRLIPRDLETICLKCLEKKPASRFQSAREIADELTRYRHKQPIQTRPTGPFQKAVRWSARRPYQAAVLVMLMALAVVGPLVAIYQARLSRRANDAAARAIKNEKLAKSNELRARRHAYAADVDDALQELDARDPGLAKSVLERHIPEPGQPDIRGFEWRYLWKRCHERLIKTLFLNEPIGRLAFSPDGRHAGVGTVGLNGSTTDGAILIVDTATGSRTYDNPHGRTIGLFYDEQNEEFTFASEEGHVQRFSGSGVATIPQKQPNQAAGSQFVERMHETSDVVSVSYYGLISMCGRNEDEPKKEQRLPEGHIPISLAVSRNDRWCAVLCQGPRGTELLVYDLPSFTLHLKKRLEDRESNGALCFHPDSSKVVVGRKNVPSPVKVYRVSDGELIHGVENTPANADSWVGVSPDGNLVAGLSQSGGNVFVWNLNSGKLHAVFAHAGVLCAEWRDDNSIVTGGNDGCLRWWNVAGGTDARPRLSKLVFRNHWHGVPSTDRSQILTLSNDDRVRLWDLKSRNIEHLYAMNCYTSRPAFGPDDSIIGKSERGGPTLSLNSKDGKQRILHEQLDPNRTISHFTTSPCKRWLFVCDGVNYAQESDRIAGSKLLGYTFVDLESGKRFGHSLRECELYGAAFSEDSQRLHSLNTNYTFKIESVPDGTELLRLPDVFSSEAFAAMRVSPSERYFAVGGQAGTVQWWDISEKERLHRISADGRIHDIAFSPDEDTLIAACGEYDDSRDGRGEIRFLDVESGHTIVRLGRDLHTCTGLALTPDELQLTTVHFDGSIFIWDGASDEEVDRQRSLSLIR